MIKIICLFCKKEFLNYPSNHRKFCSRQCKSKYQKIHPNDGCFKKGHTKGFSKGYKPWNTGKKLSKKHIAKISGENNHNWKGQTIRYGYIYLLKPNHPRAHKDGYIKRANLVMEKHIGRYLTSEEIVHHINKIRDDDRIENLCLFPNKSSHQKFHMLNKYHQCSQ